MKCKYGCDKKCRAGSAEFIMQHPELYPQYGKIKPIEGCPFYNLPKSKLEDDMKLIHGPNYKK